GSERGRRTLPRRQRGALRAARPSRRYGHGAQQPRLGARVGEPPGLRRRHVADRGGEPARRDRAPLRADELGREARREPMSANGLGTQVADPERRAVLLRRCARGDWIGAAALSEPNAGSDLANVQCRAERAGDEYVVRGEKRWCGNALRADFIVLLAREADPP